MRLLFINTSIFIGVLLLCNNLYAAENEINGKIVVEALQGSRIVEKEIGTENFGNLGTNMVE